MSILKSSRLPLLLLRIKSLEAVRLIKISAELAHGLWHTRRQEGQNLLNRYFSCVLRVLFFLRERSRLASFVPSLMYSLALAYLPWTLSSTISGAVLSYFYEIFLVKV